MNKKERFEAQEQLANILTKYGGSAALKRLKDKSARSKQSLEETALRAAGNLLSSFVRDRKQATE